MPSSKRKKIGEMLVDAGLVDSGILEKALGAQKTRKERIGHLLKEMGALESKALSRILANQFHLPLIRLKEASIPPEVIGLIPANIAKKYNLVPIKIVKGKLLIAMADPLAPYAVDDIRFLVQMPVKVAMAQEEEVQAAIERHYINVGLPEISEDAMEAVGEMEVLAPPKEEEDTDRDLQAIVDLPPVVRFTNAMLAEGIRLRASDIHIEPRKNTLIVRCRIDGIMRQMMRADPHIHGPLVSRIKVISGLDISIHRKPQDGKAQVRFGNNRYDLRISSIPTSYGEKVTIRILNPETVQMTPEDLGFLPDALGKIETAITSPPGIILVTGPTGSGKTSTLYAFLNRLNTPTVNIVTVEDPVEFDVSGLNQVQINPKAGITFADGLRSILRQDPDIVMVGEIRDGETATTAFQAAQTGHLVFSTLHTNDAPSAVTRLLELGVEDFRITAGLIAVIGQRLARRIHFECRVADHPNAEIISRAERILGRKPKDSFQKGAGCRDCHQSGYAGRLGLYEILSATPALKAIIRPGVSAETIKATALAEGFTTMTTDGLRKAEQGLTTLEEVFRVAPADSDGSGPSGKTTTKQSDDFTCPDVPSGPPLNKSYSVLLVDDSEEAALLVRQILQTRGYSVTTAVSGEDALAMVRKSPPGLVITDLHMPEMDGLALVRKMKADACLREIPIILLTAEDELETEIEGIDAGADDYLTKPVNAKRLAARVRRFFQSRGKIVAIDDSIDTLEQLRRVLEGANFTVSTSDNGREGLIMIREQMPDLVLTDFRMPEMDGIELIHSIKKDAATKDIPLIMLTAQDDVDAEVAAIDAGADDYITKPFNNKRLLSRVNRLLRVKTKSADA